jgi:hypothetical protein
MLPRPAIMRCVVVRPSSLVPGRVWIVAAAMTSSSLLSCSVLGEYAVAKALASEELGCPADRIRQVTLVNSKRHYGFRGCGRDVVIDCLNGPTGAHCRPIGYDAGPW